MATIVFSNGQKVNFDGTPTQADVEQVAAKLGLHSPSSQAPQSPQTGVLGTNPNDNLYGKIINNSITRGIQKIFPGQKVGQAIGTLGGYVASNNKENYDTSAPTPLQVGGDIVQGALTVAAPGVGGETALGRIGANAALGSGLGATNAIAQGEKATDVLKQGAIGGATGGVISAAGEGLNALSKNLPRWLTKAALPKLQNKDLNYALENTKIGGVKAMAQKSTESIGNYESQIQGVLSHPEFSGVAADSKGILDTAVSQFPSSDYTTTDLLDNAKTIAPKVSKLITKIEAGQANIQDLNAVRKELDAATKSVYTSLNRPPETKMLGAALANSIREYVQTEAPETVPIFQNYSKEIGLNKALQAAVKQGETKVKLKDLVAGSTGFAAGGFKGALEGIIAERLLTSPGTQIGAAKLIRGAGKIAAPALNTAFRATKAPIIKGVTSRSNK